MSTLIIDPDVDTKELFRISVDGKWTGRDMVDLYSGLTNLYDFYSWDFVLEHHQDEQLRELTIALILQKVFGKASRAYKLTAESGIVDFASGPPYSFLSQYPARVVKPLQVVKLEYGSPGFHDLAGIGAIVGHMKDVFFRVLESSEKRRLRTIDEQKQILEVEILALDRNERFIGVPLV